MAEKLLKSTCPACGAPVSRKDRQHGFICPYCGTEFYFDVADNVPILNQLSSSQTDNDTTNKSQKASNTSNQSKKTSIWSYILIVAFILFFISAPRWFFPTPFFGSPFLPGIDKEIEMFLDLPSPEPEGKLFTSKEFEISSDTNFRIENDLMFLISLSKIGAIKPLFCTIKPILLRFMTILGMIIQSISEVATLIQSTKIGKLRLSQMIKSSLPRAALGVAR